MNISRVSSLISLSLLLLLSSLDAHFLTPCLSFWLPPSLARASSAVLQSQSDGPACYACYSANTSFTLFKRIPSPGVPSARETICFRHCCTGICNRTCRNPILICFAACEVLTKAHPKEPYAHPKKPHVIQKSLICTHLPANPICTLKRARCTFNRGPSRC